MKSDPVIEKVRKIRHEISQEFNHDIKDILDYYKSLEATYRDKIYSKASQRSSLSSKSTQS